MIVSIIMLISSLSWGAFNGYITYQVMSKDVAERNQFLVESMTSMIANLEKQVDEGKLTKEAAQSQVKDLIRQSRYENGKQYFWINDVNGQAVMHPICLI